MRRVAGSRPAPGEAHAATALGASAVDPVSSGTEPAHVPPDGRASGPASAARTFFVAGSGSARLLADRLRAGPQRVLRLLWRRVTATGGLIARRWRRSLQLRVVSTTLVVSVAVVAVLGVFLIQQIANGLLQHERTLALSQTSNGLAFTRIEPGLLGPSGASRLDLFALATALQSGSGAAISYDVVIKSTSLGRVWVTGNHHLSPSIPRWLQYKVASEQSQDQSNTLWSSPTMLMSAQGKPLAPALAVGVPISPHDQLYYVFPLAQQIQSLRVVQNTLIVAGAGLVVLLAVIVSLVTRWVVVPIRQASQAASRLSAGNLDERMPARGTDDLAALANSFNEMAASLQDKLQELEELSNVQRQFVSDVSHELRTPLTTIRIAADMLFGAKDQLDPDLRRSAEVLQGQLDRFEALLADLLEISRHDANVATLDAESADVCALVLRAASDAEQLAARTGTHIVFRLPAEPCIAEVDRRRVERVLRNLLDNAVEHGEGRDVVVTVAADRDAVAVAVRDHGCGFNQGEEQLVFDRFWRADPARARTTGGTGLGLAIALEDVRLHGGWLQAWGEPGRGSVFRLTLPCTAGGQLAGSPLPLGPDEAEVAVAGQEVVGVDALVFPASPNGAPARQDGFDD
jgi:two-component system, OmpR family, sensor histidine kinase MtrB